MSSAPVDLVVGLGQNMALVLVLLGIEHLVHARSGELRRPVRGVAMGVLFAGIALIGMQFPIQVAPGIIVDARVVLVALAGAYYGATAAAIAATAVVAYRLYLGGVGAPSGVVAISGGAVIGWLAHRRINGLPENFRFRHHAMIGLLLAGWGLCSALLLPLHLVFEGFVTRLLPVVLTYPVAVVLFGGLLGLQVRERAAREDLKASRDRLALATQTAGLGVWDWDVRNDLLVWDDGMFRIYGLDPAKFTRAYEAWVRSVHPDDRPQADAAIQSTLQGGKDFDETFRIVRPAGDVRLIRTCSRSLRDADGTVLRLVGINEDVTERHAKDDELNGYRTRLEELVTERTAQLQRVNVEAE